MNLWIYSREQHPASRVRYTPCPLTDYSHENPLIGTKDGRLSKRRHDAAHFKTDEQTGKLVIDESDSDDNNVAVPDVAGTAYREALTSVDGFTRGPDGRIKFNKDTKKRRRENAVEDEDVEMAEEEPAKPVSKKRGEAKLGHEFRAKV